MKLLVTGASGFVGGAGARAMRPQHDLRQGAAPGFPLLFPS